MKLLLSLSLSVVGPGVFGADGSGVCSLHAHSGELQPPAEREVGVCVFVCLVIIDISPSCSVSG